MRLRGRPRDPRLLLVLLTVIAACAPGPGVAVEESNRVAGDLVPDGQAGTPPLEQDLPSESDPESLPPLAPPPASNIAWGPCDDFEIPSVDALGTAGWQCARLVVAMDPFGDTSDAGDVQLALTRHEATGDRRGALVMNPGGPGGSGLQAAWGVRGAMPPELLRSFDIVSWDPRGVGQSTPSIECDGRLGPGELEYIARCVELTGRVSEFLSAPYSAADMEAIRAALGEEELNFLGFSYGSVLGATYAVEHPERLGAVVLDGVTDPLAGSVDGPYDGGFAVLADDGRPPARARFAEICDATVRCLDGLDAATAIEELTIRVPSLPTDDYGPPPDAVDGGAFERFLESVVTYPGDWELAATALADASTGDASSLAALVAGDADAEPPAEMDDDGTDAQTVFAEANYMIYCADLGPLLVGATFCDDMPENRRPIETVQRVDLERDVLLIGTQYDPLTPGYHAPEFAAALGSATHIIWEGVGHTAFPGWSRCVDDAVEDQFLRRSVPPDGTRCPFLDGLNGAPLSDTELGDELFGHGDIESLDRLERVITFRGDASAAACLARAINQESDTVISHVLLGVDSDLADTALAAADAAC